MTRFAVPARVGLILLLTLGHAAAAQTRPATAPATASAPVAPPAYVAQPPLPEGRLPLRRQFMLAGNQEGLWLVRLNDKRPAKDDDGAAVATFDAAAKPVSRKKWLWVTQNALSQPTVITPLNNQLYLLSDDPLAAMALPMEIEERPGPLPLPPQDQWPAGTKALAAFGAKDFAGAAGSSLLVVARPPAAPATAPAATTTAATATAAGAALPRLWRFYQGLWSVLGELPASLSKGAESWHLAAAGDRVVVLASNEGGSRLGVFHDNKWRVTPWTAGEGSRPLALMAFQRGMTAVVSRPVAGGQSALEVIVLDEAGAAAGRQSIHSDQGVLTWPAGATPLVSRVAEQVALVAWRDGALVFATADASGRVGKFEPTPLSGAMVPGGGTEIVQYFLYALLVAMVLATLMLRPSTPPGQFELPMTVVPASLGKRLVAFLIDTVPFMLVLSPMTRRFTEGEPLPLSQEVIRSVLQELQNSPEMGYAIVATMTAYVLYTVVMELALGATVGKMMMHIRLVGDGGRRPDFRGVLMRNLIKVMILISPPLQLLFLIVFMTRHRQHLGDMVGRTAVVRGWPAPPAAPESPDRSDQEPPAHHPG